MNLTVELLQEHSKKQALKIAGYIGDNPERFKQLINIFLNSEYRLTQRAAWVVSICAEKNPALLKPYLANIIYNLSTTQVPAVKRNTLRLLQHQTIPADLQGQLVDTCFTYLTTTEPIAVKAFSLTILANLIKSEPDLKNELRLVLADILPYASPGLLSRAQKILPLLQNK